MDETDPLDGRVTVVRPTSPPGLAHRRDSGAVGCRPRNRIRTKNSIAAIEPSLAYHDPAGGTPETSGTQPTYIPQGVQPENVQAGCAAANYPFNGTARVRECGPTQITCGTDAGTLVYDPG